MVSATDDSLKVTKKVKKKLIALKQHHRETFNDTIERLIKNKR